MRRSNKRGLTRDLLAFHLLSSLLETLISFFFIVSQEEFFQSYLRRKYKSSSFLQLCLIMLSQNTHTYTMYIVSLIKYTWHTSSQLSITMLLYFGQRQGQIMQ